MQEPSDVKISLKDYYVEPFSIIVHAGGTISIKCSDGIQAVVVIPNIKAFAELEQHDNYLEHRFPQDSDLIIKVRELPILGTYTYHVYLVNAEKFANKPNSSAPKIIIEE